MMRIAILDSGIGGITVLNEALRQMPNENYLYFADTLHVPYGTKSVSEVQAFIQQSVQMIMKYDVKALVIACNTATSIAVSQLRKQWDIPIIGMEPAVKPAVEINRSTGKRVLVFATPLTLQQSKYTELVSRVDDHRIVDSLPLPELVEYCEALQFDVNVIKPYFLNKLKDYPLDQFGTIVLGCTHYPFYKEILRDLLPSHIGIVDGSSGTVRRLSQILMDQGLVNQEGTADIQFFCSTNSDKYVDNMKRAMQILSNQLEEI